MLFCDTLRLSAWSAKSLLSRLAICQQFMTEPPSKLLKMSAEMQDASIPFKAEKPSVDDLKAAMAQPKDPSKIQVDYAFNNTSQRHDCDGTAIKFKKLKPHAIVPARGSEYAAGFDLFSAEYKTIKAGEHGMVSTDIAVELPPGSYGRVAPRSGLALKKFIDVGAGVIDVDYRGNVGVVIFNHHKEDFVINYGDKIAQLIVERIFMPSAHVVEDLSETDRGEGGFGSTGR